MSVFLVEIAPAVDASGTTETFRYATEHYTAHTNTFEGRIVSTVSIRREVRGAIGGSGGVRFSDLVLANPDGALDAWVDYAFDGRVITGYILPDAATAFGSAETIFTATMGPASFGIEEVRIPIRDRLAELEVDLHSDTYAGDNSLPNGLEGTADDIKGQIKPEPEGEVFNVAPPFVNTSKLIYQFANRPDADVTGVFEGGVELATRGSDYTDETDLTTNAPSGATSPPEDYRVLPSASGNGGFIRLRASPTHQITCDVRVGATASARTVGQVLQNLALRAPTITASDIQASDVTALDSALSDPVGYWSPRASTVLEAMTQIARGCGVWFGFDANGKLRMGQWTAPGGSPAAFVASFVQAGTSVMDSTTFDLEAFDVEPTRAEDIPAWQVTALYDRNYTPQPGLETAVSDARRAEVSQEWKRVASEDATVKDKHINARSLEIETAWANSTGASAFAAEKLSQDKVRRLRCIIDTPLVRSVGTTVDIGDEVRVIIDRYGQAGGKDYRVLATEIDPIAGTLRLEVWG